jgi:hypothetical protein
MLRKLLLILSLLPFVSFAVPLRAQSAPLGVYLDCNDFRGCDFDFFRTEITAVNWVRDRQVADVHILVTTQSTGAGGREYTSTFLGRGAFTGVVDTLRYVSSPDAQQDEVRRGLARTFTLGLVRYLARTPAAGKLTVTFADATKSGAAPAQTQPGRDPWNAWVFRTSVNGYTQGEASLGSLNIFGDVSGNRTTAKRKTNVSINDSYNQSSYTLSSGETFTNFQRSYGASLLHVESLGEHWSAGLRSSIAASTFSNQKRVLQLAPAVEYDVFPYSQSTRRQLRIEYNVGSQWVRYNDTTVFDRLAESLPSQQLSISGSSRETWGSVDLGVAGTSYLAKPSKYNASVFSSISARLFKGLSANLFVNYSKFNDQFYLLKHDFTDEEILTRQFARQTQYRYFVNFGLSYTFGSILNNVVNPRFGGGGGGGMMIMQ